MTTPINDGGPAFPRSGYYINDDYYADAQEGMSRRDLFAGLAMQGLVRDMRLSECPYEPEDVARDARMIAALDGQMGQPDA